MTLHWANPEDLNLRDDQFSLSGHQMQQINLAFQSRLGILLGRPGTGKTTLIVRVIRHLLAKHGEGSVGVVAPTGKAAARLSQALHDCGAIPVKATTIHSFLRATPSASGWDFYFSRNNKAWHRFIICDEISMAGTGLSASLLDAMNPFAHLLLSGDAGQLPPVDHGSFLRDLSRLAKLPRQKTDLIIGRGELTEIQRNSGDIVTACSDILDHGTFQTSDVVDIPAGKNLWLSQASNSGEAVVKLDKVLEAIGSGGSTQVITAKNDNSPLSRMTLNLRLQESLNRDGERTDLNPFRTGDKVICSRNSWLSYEFSDSGSITAIRKKEKKVYVANGEQGIVRSIEPFRTVVCLSDPQRVVIVPRGDSESSACWTGCDFDLGYVISVHKSQGSEFKNVIVMLDETFGAKMVCSREWLYTAISRAKEFCVLIGRKSVADEFIARTKLDERKTFLVENVCNHG